MSHQASALARQFESFLKKNDFEIKNEFFKKIGKFKIVEVRDKHHNLIFCSHTDWAKEIKISEETFLRVREISENVLKNKTSTQEEKIRESLVFKKEKFVFNWEFFVPVFSKITGTIAGYAIIIKARKISKIRIV